MRIILTGSPKSTNTLYKSHCRFGYPIIYLCKKGKELKEQYCWEIKSQHKGQKMTEDIKCEIRYFMGTKRKFDLDNGGKLVIDSLMDGGIIKDDSQIMELYLYKDYCKEQPRIEILISKL